MAKQPTDYAVIDVETTEIAADEIPKTKFWGYADEDGYKKFNTTDKFLKFLRTLKTPKVLLHHANFDVLQLLVDGANVKILRSHNGKLIRSQIGIHTLLNTYSCFPCALKKEDKEAHKDTLFGAFGHGFTSLKNLEDRNYEDCVTGRKVFLELNDMFYDLCGVHPLSRGTIASTAFHAAELHVGRDMPKDLRFLSAYRGGRVEVFDLRCYSPSQRDYETYRKEVKRWNKVAEANGQVPHSIFEWKHSVAHKFDINSSYPRSIVEAPKSTELLRIMADTRDFHCPFYDANREDLLFFPNGRFHSYVFRDVWEKYVEPYAEKTKIKILSRHKIDLTWLTELAPLIHRLYEKKNTSTGGLKIVCKFLLNSMYGRIGLRGDSERARVMDYRPDGDEVTAYPIGKRRWLVFDTVQRECDSNFPFAGYITDNARGRLFTALKQNAPLYGDTDSVVNKFKTFVGTCGSGLGEWKYEGSQPFQAINVKDYLWGDEEVRKGGSKYLKWTLKQFASGKAAEEVLRTRTTELRKRHALPNGETVPIVI